MYLSVILPVHSEIDTVKDIVDSLQDLIGDYIYEMILVISYMSPEETFKICFAISEKYSKVKLYTQKSDGLGNAIREGMDRVSGTHILMMDSDGEMNPRTVPEMVDKLLNENLDLVVASRWMEKGGVKGYSLLKFLFVHLFNYFFRFLYRTNIHDLSFGFKIMKTEISKNIRWEGVRHEIATETTLKPIRLGYKVGEVPTVWVRRICGSSKNWMLANVSYIKIAFRILREKYR